MLLFPHLFIVESQEQWFTQVYDQEQLVWVITLSTNYYQAITSYPQVIVGGRGVF